jgi:D-beta-D-heptose 7-phosphate kinase/D-beta-D-heptose 1-phosphate adenosyltransferase
MPVEKKVLVSGGFDPLHIGHVRMMQEAAKYGKVIVALNSDDWLCRKKGYAFMPLEERRNLVEALGCVWLAVAFDDSDDTAIDAIRRQRPDYFANGGDRTTENVPEQAICDELGVKMLWGIGGTDKPQSSSWLVNNAMEQLRDSDHGN